MPQYLALTYTADVDWSQPDYAQEMTDYGEFGQAAAAIIRGGNVLYPTAAAVAALVLDPNRVLGRRIQRLAGTGSAGRPDGPGVGGFG